MPPAPSHPRGAERAAPAQAEFTTAHGSAFVESKVRNLMIQQEPSVIYVPFENTKKQDRKWAKRWTSRTTARKTSLD